jgi:hypothetical protein
VVGPVSEIVLELPVNVPLVLMFPPMLCEKDPASNVVPVLMVRLPFIVSAAPAVNETLPEPELLVRFPATVIALPGIVFVTAPDELLRTRSPYD